MFKATAELERTNGRSSTQTVNGAGREARELAVEWVSDPADLASLADAWDGLAGPDRLLTSEHAWNLAAAEVFGVGRGLRVALVRDRSGRLRAAGAVAQHVEQPGLLELVGTSVLHEPTDVVAADEDALGALAEALGGLHSSLLLRRLPAESRLPAALRASLRLPGLVLERPTPGCPVIALDSSWEEPESRLSSRRRSDLRRAQRRAEALGELTFDLRCPGPGAVDELLAEAMAVEEHGWKGRAGTALLHADRERAFYQRYCELAAGRGNLRIAFLRIAGKAAAMQVAVETAGRLWLLKTGYDEDFARCSPGALLNARSIAYAVGRGLSGYEFLGSPEPWTRPWTECERSCIALVRYRTNLRSLPMIAATARQAMARRRRAKAAAQH
jgi:CelD/BcsL family acetyltransferase involved in cellulose biosynthesis